MNALQLIDALANPRVEWLEQGLNTVRDHVGAGLQFPKVDMYPVKGGVELKADIPGLTKKDITVTVHGDTLTLAGRHVNRVERHAEDWHYAERRSGSFTRTVKLPFPTNPGAVTAQFENGVLTVALPMPENYNPTGRIEIQ